MRSKVKLHERGDGTADRPAQACGSTARIHSAPAGQERSCDGQAGGPNATWVRDDLEAAMRALKADRDGEIEVAGPDLARSLTELDLIDEYRIYLHPVVLGHGRTYFAAPRPPLRLVSHDRIGEDVVRLSYVPA